MQGMVNNLKDKGFLGCCGSCVYFYELCGEKNVKESFSYRRLRFYRR
jgi:hypothetical protein